MKVILMVDVAKTQKMTLVELRNVIRWTENDIVDYYTGQG